MGKVLWEQHPPGPALIMDKHQRGVHKLVIR